VSQPMSTSLSKLSVQVFCGTADVKIRLVGPADRKIELQPQLPGRWETLIVNAPKSPFVLSIENVAAGTPVAIGEIKELGTCSVFAQSLIRHAVLILSIGLCFWVVFAVTALTRPGVSLANVGLLWLLILLTALTGLAGTYCWRNYDATEVSFELQTNWAADLSGFGRLDRAGLHLREALWLRPDDAEGKKALGILQARGLHEPVPDQTQDDTRPKN